MLRSGFFSRSTYALSLAILLLAVSSASCIVQTAEPTDQDLAGTVEALEGLLTFQATNIASQATMISYLATRGPGMIASTPAHLPTPYYPVAGSVIIEDGRCCAGGTAGETIELTARFEASSPFDEITHMRVHSGSGPQRADQIPGTSAWEPFTESRTFTVEVSLNWVGFFVTAQFRDAAGNLSPVAWDDISIEGMPPSTP